MRSALLEPCVRLSVEKAPSPRVSVVMPVRNGGCFLSEAIQSILGQTFRDFEFIIVDDGSVDNTREILAQAAARDPRVRILSQPPSGIVAALEAARACARGTYLARMDADDVSSPDRLARQVEFLDRNPLIIALGGQVRIIDATGRALKLGRWPVSEKACKTHLEIGSPLCHPAVMMRATAVEACGGYKGVSEPAEDYDLWLRLSKIGEFANLNEIVLDYRVHSNSVTFTRAKANARAAALALLSFKFGEQFPFDANADARTDWPTIEARIKPSQRMFARAAYLCALIRNGAIADNAEFQLLLNSLADLTRDPIVRQRTDALSFMIIRGAYQIRRSRSVADIWRLLQLGVRYFPVSMVHEATRTLANRMSARPKLVPQVQAVNFG